MYQDVLFFWFHCTFFFGWLLNIWYFLRLLNLGFCNLQDHQQLKPHQPLQEYFVRVWQKAVAMDSLFYMDVQKASMVEKLQHYCTVVTEADAQLTLTCQIKIKKTVCLSWFSEHTVCPVFRGLLDCFFPHLKLNVNFPQKALV